MQQNLNEAKLVTGRAPWIAAALMLTAGLALTMMAAVKSKEAIHTESRYRFSQQFERLDQSIRTQFDQPVRGLDGLAGLHAANGKFQRQPFKTWVESQQLSQNYMGARAFGFMERVPRAQLDRFLATERADQGASFAVKTQGNANDLFVVKYIEPRERNLPLWGVDAGSDASIRESIERVIRSGEPSLTRAFSSDSKSPWGFDFIYLAPVYKTAIAPQSVGDRESAIAGLVFAPVATDDLLLATLALSDGMADFELLDAHQSKATSLVFSSAKSVAANPDQLSPQDFSKRLFHNERAQLIGGRRLTIQSGSSAVFEGEFDHTTPVVIGATGSALSVLLAAIFWLVMAGRGRAQALAGAMTQDLRRLARIVKSTSHVVFAGDADRNIVWVNEAFTRLTGHALEEAQGRKVDSLLRLDTSLNATVTALLHALDHEENLRCSLPLRTLDGTLRWFDVDLQTEHDDRGQYAGFIVIAADISAERESADRVAAALRENEALMAALDQHSIVSVADHRGVITYANDMFTQISGYTLDELIGSTHRIVKSDQQPDDFWESMWRTISAGHTWRATVCNRSKDGSLYWVDSVIAPFFDDAGNIEKYVSIRSNVTPAHKAQTDLASERAHLNAILEGTDAGTWEWEVPTGKVIINSRWAEIIGYTVTEFGPTTIDTWTAQCHPDDLLLAKELLTQHFAGTLSSYVCEMRMRHRDGHWVWVLARGKVSSWVSAGQPHWVSGIHLDISVQKQLQSELHQNNQVMQSILSNIPVALSVFDSDLKLIAKNDRFLELLDFPGWLFEADETTFESLIRYNASRGEYGTGDVEQAIQFIIERARNTEAHQFERVRPNGLALEVRGAPMPGGGFITTYADITARKESEAAIVRSTGLLQSVLDSASEVAVISMGLDGIITLFNKGAERLFGCSSDDVVGHQTPAIFFDLAELEARASAMSAQLGRPVVGLGVLIDESVLGKRVEWSYIHADGHHFSAALVVTAMLGVDGKRTGYLSVSHDITAEKDNEQALHMAVELAEQAAQSKGQFLANMSHEIRTPMNAILGMLKLLQSTSLDTRQQDYANKTESAARSLLGLLNDILDFSKAEAGKMQLDPQPFDVDNLMRDLSVILSANIGAKDIEILFDLDPALPPCLVGDSMRLQQVLINLGGNAIKFTEQGAVVVSIKVEERVAGNARLLIAVKDSGIGIDPVNQQHIFSGFSQAEASTTRRFGGTGLGLSICRRLVDLMGGDLLLTSELGSGSTFYFEITLPVGESMSQARALQTPSHGAAMGSVVAMVVDDNKLARDVLEHMAQGLGWQVESVDSGARALQCIEQRALRGLPAFDAIFLDWKMPEMDGWETAQRIRKMNVGAPAPFIVMVTAHSRDMLTGRTPEERALLDGFLVKPLTASMLEMALVEAQEDRKNPHRKTVGTSVKKAKRLRGMRLLVVEDNLINQQVAKELLSAEGATITLAGNGQLGVDAVACAQPQFDAVLMDIQMPVMDGYTASVTIRHELGLYDLPIIAMTANAMASDREACLAAGMTDHIGKPFDLQQLIGLLLRHTGHAPDDMTDLVDATSVPPIAEPAPTGENDIAGAIDRLEGNTELYSQILQAFLTEVAAVPEQFGAIMARHDYTEAGRLLHTIKGLSLTVGANALSEVCRQGERTVKSAATDGNESAIAASTDLGHLLAHAITTTIDTLQAVQADLYRQPIATPVAAETLSAPALVQELETLQTLLRNSDMRALDIFAALDKQQGSALGSLLTPLQSAMIGFDFPQAVVQCDLLIQQFSQNNTL